MIARPEHPKPQFQREAWRNLNGKWDFCFDESNSGEDRGLWKAGAAYDKTIVVPFCPESKLSGIGDTDFHAAVWYRRTFDLSEKELAEIGKYLSEIGTTDADTQIASLGAKCAELKRFSEGQCAKFKKDGALYFKLCVLLGVVAFILIV